MSSVSEKSGEEMDTPVVALLSLVFFFEQGVQMRLGGLTASTHTQVPTYLALFLRLRLDLGTRLVLTQIIYMYLETPLCINF